MDIANPKFSQGIKFENENFGKLEPMEFLKPFTVIDERRKQTLYYLSIATIFSWLTVFLGEILPPIFPPIFFGIAINLSNENYFKFRLSHIIIPIFFCAIYLFGTIPFLGTAVLLVGSNFISAFISSISAFVLVNLTLNFALKSMTFGKTQLLSSMFFSFCALVIHIVWTNQSILHYKLFLVRPDLTVLLYQLFMALNIISAMKFNSMLCTSQNSDQLKVEF